MLLTQLTVQHFRKFSSRTFSFSPKVTVVCGKNASGKTSLIEAISVASTGNSFRAGKVDQMVAFNHDLARVMVVLAEDGVYKQSKDNTHTIEITLTRGIVQGKRVAKRLYSLNDVRKRKKDVVGKFQVVVFRPEDMRLIEGSPSRRRQFIDTVLANIDQEYRWSLSTYEQALKRKNKLLEKVREGLVSEKTLHYWDQQLLKHGQIVQQKRSEFFSSFNHVSFPLLFSVTYQPSQISQERLEKYYQKSIAAGYSLIGPHKDDFLVELQTESETPFDVSIYGSRGQQRMAVLWLKICELTFSQEKTDQKPILLLDDILSELDVDFRDRVIELMSQFQTIVTTADDDVSEMITKEISTVDTINLTV